MQHVMNQHTKNEINDAIRRTAKAFPFEGYIPAEESSDQGVHASIASAVIRHLEPDAKILDFGSGPCDKTAVLQFLGYRCSACDDLKDEWHKLPGNRDKILSFASECGINLKHCENGEIPFKEHDFDLVMLHHVLEHLHDSPRDLLNDLLSLTHSSGILFVTVPNAVNIRKRLNVLAGKTNLPRFEGYYWYPGTWRGHVREYVKNDLLLLAEYLGLEILELKGCDHMLSRLSVGLRPAYRVVTSAFPGWKDSWMLIAKKKNGWSPKKTLPKGELDRILGRATSYNYT